MYPLVNSAILSEKTVGFYYTKVGSEFGFERVKDWGRSGVKNLRVGGGGGGSAWIRRHFWGSEISSLLIETPVLRNEKTYLLFFLVKKNLFFFCRSAKLCLSICSVKKQRWVMKFHIFKLN
jgi:hypothetical protein